jgi:hypothetical protein
VAAWRRIAAGVALPLALIVAVQACGDGPAPSPASAGSLRFTDVAAEAGIRFRHTFGWELPINLLMTTGAGAAFLDYDRDGLLDAFLVNGQRVGAGDATRADGAPSHALYHNDGDGRFTDVTARAGLARSTFGQGCAVGDFDGDGFDDLYLTSFGPNLLYRNRGDGTFEDVTARAGVSDPRWSTGAAFLDYDGDGDLDLYVANYVRLPKGFEPSARLFRGPRFYEPEDDGLYRNDGQGVFVDVSSEAGLVPGGRGLSVAAVDLDRDGDAEIFVANDLTQNWLYENAGDGTLAEIGEAAGVGFDAHGNSTSAMGVDVLDVDGDGLLDVHVTNFTEEKNNLYRNLGGLVFRDDAHRLGLDTDTFDWIGWATRFVDFDLDGELDAFVGNGGIWLDQSGKPDAIPYEQPNLLFLGTGEGRFREVGASCGPDFARALSTRGAAFGDFDRDGDVDVLINNCDGPAQLLRNETDPGDRWLAVRFVGRAPNTAALGAHARLTVGDRILAYDVQRPGTYLSASEPGIHCALLPGEDEGTLRVTWPSGETSTSIVHAGRVNVVEEPGRPPGDSDAPGVR